VRDRHPNFHGSRDNLGKRRRGGIGERVSAAILDSSFCGLAGLEHAQRSK
jgi:hypothetical protein